MLFAEVFSVFKPDKVQQWFPKVKGIFFNLMHGMLVWFLIKKNNQEDTFSLFFFFFSSSMFLFISVQLINSSGCHLRMKSGLKPLASVELKWRSTFFLLAQYMCIVDEPYLDYRHLLLSLSLSAYVHGHGNIPPSDVHSDSNGTSERSERMFTINNGGGAGTSSSRAGDRAGWV